MEGEHALSDLVHAEDLGSALWLAGIAARCQRDPAGHAILPLDLEPEREVKEQIIGYLRDRQMLLALDNLEQIPDAAALLDELLSAAPGLKCLVTSRRALGLPAERPHGRHVYHLYVVRTPRRNELAAFLKARNIQTGIHYPVPTHRQPAVEKFAPPPLPTTERLVDEILTLPISAGHTEAEIDAVAKAVREFFGA